MRRKDREITDRDKIEQIISACHCCRLGFQDAGEVYIVPLSFGYIRDNETYIFYFHGATEGRKIDLIRTSPHVGFEMDTGYVLHEADEACGYAARFQSIIGNGVVSIVEDREEKKKGLSELMKHTSGKDGWEFREKMVDAVCVFRLVVETMSCKEHL